MRAVATDPRITLVISAAPSAELPLQAQSGRVPRKDYLELAKRCGGQILYTDCVRKRRITRLVARLAGVPIAQALAAFLERDTYDTVFTDAENIGLFLALLFKLTRTRRRHVMIAHLPSTRWKQVFYRVLRVHSHIDTNICHASRQRWILERKLQVPAHKVALLPYCVDTAFWQDDNAPESHKVCSVGLEFRDYPTLIRAVTDVDVELMIAAASHWSRRRNETQGVSLPKNVKVGALDYSALRQLYAESVCVVIPLYDNDFQAGITVLLEAMSMGKAIIITRTRGQIDVVRDDSGLPTSRIPGYPSGFGEIERSLDELVGPTGMYVTPGDADDLRNAIRRLVANPDEAHRLGRNGRRVVEQLMTIEQYAERISLLLRPGIGASNGNVQPQVG